MPRTYFNSLDQQERQRQRAREVYAKRVREQQGREVVNLQDRRAQELAAAIREAIRRGWSERIITRNNSGVYMVAGRDKTGFFHFGSSKDNWQAAFDSADQRAKKEGK